MIQCPYCQQTAKQVKNGKTQAGSQLYKCQTCQRKYTPNPKSKGYDKTTRQQALRLVFDGNSQRQAARHAGVSHGTVANWVKEHADSLPEKAPIPHTPAEVAEQDEMFTFIGEKKTEFT
ncbi:MAG: helix-turn-helix domain-containing protein [Chloroflexota bacterium]